MKAGKSRTGYQKPMGSELRALREQREASAPTSEAGRREASFLRNIAGAGDDLEWILFNQAWTQLDFERVGDWWEQRVLPVLEKLDLRPSASLAERVIAAIEADEQVLPKTQRRTQREIASIAKTSQSRVSRLLADSRASGSDLGGATGADDPQPEPAPADIPDALRTAIENTAASIGAGIAAPAADPATDLCSGDPTRCGTCGDPIPKIEQDAGHLRCRSCDSSTLHKSLHGDDGDFNGVCERCTQAAASVSTEPAQTGLGGSPTGATSPVPVGDYPEERIEEEADQPPADSPAAGWTEKDRETAAESLAKLEAGTWKPAGSLRHLLDDCGGPDGTSTSLWPGTPRTLTDEVGHATCVPCLRAVINSPAAATTSLPDGGGDPTPEPEQQPGHDSPTGQDRSDAGANFPDAPESAAIATTGRSEIDHHQVSGVSPGGEAPAPRNAVEPEELEDGDASLLPSPSDYLMLYAAQFALHLAEFDPVAVGPQLLDDDVATLLVHVDGFEDFVKSLIKARNP
jgi:hypothetical protein